MKARHAIAIASAVATLFAGSAFAAGGPAVKSRLFDNAAVVGTDDRGAPVAAPASKAVRNAPAVAAYGRDGLKPATDTAVRTAGEITDRAGRDVPQAAVVPVVRRTGEANPGRFGRA